MLYCAPESVVRRVGAAKYPPSSQLSTKKFKERVTFRVIPIDLFFAIGLWQNSLRIQLIAGVAEVAKQVPAGLQKSCCGICAAPSVGARIWTKRTTRTPPLVYNLNPPCALILSPVVKWFVFCNGRSRGLK